MSQITRLFVLASAALFVSFVSTSMFTLSDAVEVSQFGQEKTMHAARPLLSVGTEAKAEEKILENNDEGTTHTNMASHAINDVNDDVTSDEEGAIATSARYGGSSSDSGNDGWGYWGGGGSDSSSSGHWY